MRFKPGVAVLCLVAACDSTGPGGGGNVAIRFGSGLSSAARSSLMAGDRIAADELTIRGSDGTLVIQDIRFIVEEMRLESSDTNSACAEDERDDNDDILVSRDRRRGENEKGQRDRDDECEFEGGPFIVDLSLDGNTTVSTRNVPAGTYDSFRFKIDDLEGGDDDEDDDRANTPNLLNEIRAVYPGFPARASMVVKGTQNGTPFIVYFRSKLRIRQSIDPPLVVPGNNVLTVKIDPTEWFRNGDQVLNLAALNGRLVELGEGFRNGVKGSHKGED